MSSRRFENKLGDYTPGAVVKPDDQMLKARILDLANQLMNKFPAVPRNPTTERTLVCLLMRRLIRIKLSRDYLNLRTEFHFIGSITQQRRALILEIGP